jgi:tetratricopeptide (TPR) repeat protein
MAKGSRVQRARTEGGRLIAIAGRFLEARRYAQAIDPLWQATRLMPDDARVHNDLGLAYLFAGRVTEAITWLQRSIALQPTDGRTHYNLGIAFEHAGDDGSAILAHLRAVQLSPSLAAAHARRADLLWEMGRRKEAAAAYEQVFASEPGNVLGRISKARSLSADNRHPEAEEETRRILKSEPSNSAAHLLLGQILQEIGRFDEAAASFEQSIDSAPSDAPWQATAHSNLVSCKRLEEGDRPWIARILLRLRATEWQRALAPALVERQLMTLHFAAGKGFDDLGDYPSAMHHFVAANQIRQRIFPFNLKEAERRFKSLMVKYTSEFLAAHSMLGHPDPTPILIIGMPRSGTTLLERIISSHPRVRGCGELNFWNDQGPRWLNAEPNELACAAEQLRGDYLRVLRSRAPEPLHATDKMPFNFLWVGLIHTLFPNAKIVHSRRDPIDTCLSIYTNQVGMTWGFASRLGDLASYYRLYLRLMDHWRSVVRSDRLLDLDYEDLVAKPEETTRRLVEFCGLEWDSACLRPDENRDAVATASLWQARQPIYRSSVKRSQSYKEWIEELLQALQAPDSLKS